MERLSCKIDAGENVDAAMMSPPRRDTRPKAFMHARMGIFGGGRGGDIETPFRDDKAFDWGSRRELEERLAVGKEYNRVTFPSLSKTEDDSNR